MVDILILEDMNVDPDEIEQEIALAMSDPTVPDFAKAVDESIRDFTPGSLVKGRVIGVHGDDVLFDVGLQVRRRDQQDGIQRPAPK